MSFSLIAAVGKNREIGNQGGLLFEIPEDQKFFKDTTMGHPVVMGRKTFYSIGRVLPGRMNFVVTRQGSVEVNGKVVARRGDLKLENLNVDTQKDENGKITEGVAIIPDVDRFIQENVGVAEEIFVIGGGEIYEKFLPYAKRLYLTEVEADAPADTFFPEFNATEYIKSVIKEDEYKKVPYKICVYDKRLQTAAPVTDPNAVMNMAENGLPESPVIPTTPQAPVAPQAPTTQDVASPQDSLASQIPDTSEGAPMV